MLPFTLFVYPQSLKTFNLSFHKVPSHFMLKFKNDWNQNENKKKEASPYFTLM